LLHYDGTLPTPHYRQPQPRPNMAVRIHTTTSSISVIYCIFCAITFNISTLIRVRCKDPMFERAINRRRRQKVYHVTFTCDCGTYHSQKNTRMYELQLTHALSEYDTLFQNERLS